MHFSFAESKHGCWLRVFESKDLCATIADGTAVGCGRIWGKQEAAGDDKAKEDAPTVLPTTLASMTSNVTIPVG